MHCVVCGMGNMSGKVVRGGTGCWKEVQMIRGGRGIFVGSWNRHLKMEVII